MTDFSSLPIFRKLSPRQYEAFAYLATGGWNTLFMVGLSTVLFRLFGGKVHYLVLAVPVNILAVTNAFPCYKLFVFRMKGNWLKEYFRCWLVYGGGSLLGMFLLFLLVRFCRIQPDLANLLGTGIVIVCSCFGHRFFSFRKGGAK